MFLVFYYFYSLYILFCWNQIFIFAILKFLLCFTIARVFCNSLFKCLFVPSGSLEKEREKIPQLRRHIQQPFCFRSPTLTRHKLTTAVLAIFLGANVVSYLMGDVATDKSGCNRPMFKSKVVPQCYAVRYLIISLVVI